MKVSYLQFATALVAMTTSNAQDALAVVDESRQAEVSLILHDLRDALCSFISYDAPLT